MFDFISTGWASRRTVLKTKERGGGGGAQGRVSLRVCERKMVTIAWRLGKWRAPPKDCGRGARLKQRIEVPERDSQRLPEAKEVLKRDVSEVADCSPKVKKGLTDLKLELEKPKEEIRGASVGGGRCSCSAAPARRSSGSPPNAALRPLKPAPVEASAESNSLKTSCTHSCPLKPNHRVCCSGGQ
jgi:hypothetical protein